ncbi:hypothetical protein [Kingella oralis]|uniref:hypothetical protein n=1 Tax=Kingella oralis TaxID=505 RepID=UPI0034E437CD
MKERFQAAFNAEIKQMRQPEKGISYKKEKNQHALPRTIFKLAYGSHAPRFGVI